jgi:hypothetical protein
MLPVMRPESRSAGKPPAAPLPVPDTANVGQADLQFDAPNTVAVTIWGGCAWHCVRLSAR